MRFVIALVLMVGCARVEPHVDRKPSRNCPSLTNRRADIDALGGVMVQEVCTGLETCDEGPYTCRCDHPRGGAPRPGWWLCRRARAKTDGCPDDDVLLRGDACTTAGQSCVAPQSCGCSATTMATCTNGHWELPTCGPCLAP